MDTGVGHTIIGEDDLAAIQAHKPVQVKPSTMNLVPYATTEMEQPIKLPVKGKVDITIENMAGARIDTTAFVVRGEAEALLGARDSLKLGIIQLNRNGAKTAKEPEINIRNVGDTSEKGPLGIADMPITDGVRRIIAQHTKVFTGHGRMKDTSGVQGTSQCKTGETAP